MGWDAGQISYMSIIINAAFIFKKQLNKYRISSMLNLIYNSFLHIFVYRKDMMELRLNIK